jgi:hypothetical protein
MSVRAKFRCNSVTKTDHWEKDKGQLASISLSAVMSNGDNEENKKFFAATPSGQITLGTVNPAAFEQFEEGKEYYVTFEKAE